jgi:hypothetical protein
MNAENTTTTVTAIEAVRYPTQPIWPGLIARLYTVAERMERRHFANIARQAEFLTLSVGEALRWLERQGHDLNPTNPQERSALCTQGSRRIRRIVASNAFHFLRNHVMETSLDASASKEWHPRGYLYGARKENADAPLPLEDPFGGATGGMLTTLLVEEFGMTPVRAWAWVLLQSNARASREDTLDYDDIARLLGTRGFVVNPALLRQWKKRYFDALDAQKDCIQARLASRLAAEAETSDLAQTPCHKTPGFIPTVI